VELQEDEKRTENILPPKINYYWTQREMKKTHTQTQTPAKKG
jgi:hypothetical protein